jgi:AcrR family transcriptional regulator
MGHATFCNMELPRKRFWQSPSAMKSTSDPRARRQPRQQRSKKTVNTMLDAVTVVLKRHGPDGVTTNRISEAAGFSIGSLYQYFPDKRAIYRALHERHVNEVRAAITQALAENASASLEDFTRALVGGWSMSTPPTLSCINSSRPWCRKGRRSFAPR